jgi:hypothetical protein
MDFAKRIKLVQTISALPSSQFMQLVYAINPPKGIVSSDTAPQGKRAVDLLEWAESPLGCGIKEIKQAIQVLAGNKKKSFFQKTLFRVRQKSKFRIIRHLNSEDHRKNLTFSAV